MACSRTSATRSSGCCATCSAARSCWPKASCPRRETTWPIYEADRHAKVQLKKKVRGIRPIERKVEGRDDDEARVIRGYCAAVRSALTDDGRPPLVASGLKLVDRLTL